MSDSILTIRNKDYILGEVLLQITLTQDGKDSFITFDLFADNHELSQAGLAINSMTRLGTQARDLEHTTFELDESADDPFNELRESVICEPGTVLELSYLQIVFGSFEGGQVHTQLEAEGFRLDDETFEVIESEIPIRGDFMAQLRIGA